MSLAPPTRLPSVLASAAVLFLSTSCPWNALRAQAPPRFIAYEIPAGTAGNQEYGGALGMDFDVALDILITRLGVFDSGSDGLMRTITARLFDRDTFVELGMVEFTPADPGDLVGGSRFKEFELDLPAGFRGTIVASGYGVGEPNGNQGGIDLGLSMNDGGCAIQFTGGGRFGNDPAAFPGTADGGPPNRYGSGTFEFEPQESLMPRGGIAYAVPAGTLGNQNAAVALGLDFNVNTPIKITRLGVFDSGSDGLAVPITARVYNRSTRGEVARLEFTLDSQGDLVEGSRFKPLEPPLQLPAGFRGTMVAEGYGDLELNGNGMGNPVAWTMDNGGCAVSFTGGGRFGPAGGFPGTGDSGPPNRYAAGTFEFELDASPPARPDAPGNLAAVAGDGRVDLSWDASAGAIPAALYRVYSGPGTGGPFTRIAEIAATAFSHTGLANEVTVCYLVRAVSATGFESFDSAKRCAVPAGPLPQGRSIAYQVPAGTPGNQAYGGALGMDFDVLADILVQRLGVFDDGSDGLNLPISARIFDRDTLTELARVDFTPDDPGVLLGGSRFKRLEPPLELLEGFHYTMVASGYGANERNGNQGVSPVANLTTDDGGCRIAFVGTGRFGNDPAAFPGTPDGGPPNRYAAGTFDFEPLGPPVPPAVEPPAGVLAAATEDSVTLSWQPPTPSACVAAAVAFKVLRSTNGGPFTEIARPESAGYVDSGLQKGIDVCYVVRSITEGNRESADSAAACATTGSFIAYRVPAGTEGTQIDGFPVGMDFDVLLDVQVTRLGAFDSGSDGLAQDITIRLYDRETESEVVSLVFTPADPGVLLNGSRFKPLVPPLELPAGFKGSIVAEGYGVAEPNGSGGPWTTDPGPCSLFYVGTGRGIVGGAVLPLPNQAGRPDQYAAGTFQFEPDELATPRDAIAYQVPGGTIGNQDFDGALGLDFDVNVDIEVIRLGVFDSGSDGLFRDITARLFDRDARTEVAQMLFTAVEPGELVEGSRFKDLDPPLTLPAGFRGTISASGYGPEELNGNTHSEGLVPWSADDGGCAITFVGSGRFGLDPTAFPGVPDGGPVNRYASGTFEFEVDSGPPVVVFTRADADQNGFLEITDAIQVLTYLFLGDPTQVPDCFDAADADDNGAIEITDPIIILGYLFLGDVPPAPPFDPPGPRCGPDPTPDDPLNCVFFTECP